MTHSGFAHFAKQAPCKFALATPDGRHWSRGELQEKARRSALALRQLALQPKDRIVAVLPNGADLLALQLAAESTNCVLEVFDQTRGYELLARTLAEKNTWALVVDENSALQAQQAVESAAFPRSAAFAIGDIPGFHSFSNLLGTQPDTALTSAGTVHPGALLERFQIPIEQNNVHYCCLGLSDPYAMQWVTESLHYGHAVILPHTWNALEMLYAIEQYRVTSSYMTTQLFDRLLQAAERARQLHDVSSISHLVTTGPSLPEFVQRGITEWFGPVVYEDHPNSRLLNSERNISSFEHSLKQQI